MSSQLPFIVCLMGPTASGKTQLAIELVQRFPFEIISVDSAMIYRGMDIGTAKPDVATLQMAPHRLIDIRDPAEAYSAGQFRRDALHEIEAVFARGKIPLLVGGTMLYFRALQKGLSELPTANTSVRLALQEQADQIGWPALHEKLGSIDLVSAKRIHPNDVQRIQRALEIYEISGKTLTEWQQNDAVSSTKYQMINLIVAPNQRALLHQRIEQRFDEMLTKGFVKEVTQLFERGDLSLDNPAIRCVGYRQVWEHLLGNLSSEEMRDRAIFATRQFAKRQLTWLRNWTHAHCFDSENQNLLDTVISVIFKKA